MADKKYIAYDDAFHALDTVAMPISTYECLVGRLCDIPAADVRPVVYCKDCYWWTKQEASIQGRCSRLSIYPTGNWYCANGQKRTNGGDE